MGGRLYVCGRSVLAPHELAFFEFVFSQSYKNRLPKKESLRRKNQNENKYQKFWKQRSLKKKAKKNSNRTTLRHHTAFSLFFCCFVCYYKTRKSSGLLRITPWA